MYNNYKELEDGVVDWLDREDIRPRVSTFIDLVTRQASRELRVPTMERTVIKEVYADGSISIPADLVELANIDWVTGETYNEQGVVTSISNRMPLKRGSIDLYKQSRGADVQNAESTPTHFAREASWFKAYPLPPATEFVIDGNTGNSEVIGHVEVHYFALPFYLELDTDTNWLLDVAPECYLYGALSHGFEYTRDYERAAFWNQRFNDAIVEIQAWSVRADANGGMIEVPLGV